MAWALHHPMAMLNKSDELKDRVESRRLKMQSKLAELKADTRHEAIEAKEKIRRGLDELEASLRDGWDKASDKLKDWLSRHDDERSSKP